MVIILNNRIMIMIQKAEMNTKEKGRQYVFALIYLIMIQPRLLLTR